MPQGNLSGDERRRRAGHGGERALVWALVGQRAGDNAQVLRLADALDRPYEVKQLAFNAWHHAPNLLLGAGLRSLRSPAAAGLAPPWPHLVMSAGKRSVPVARWIRRQSGGRTRLVHVGRPRAPLAAFDLVVAPPQYRLPPGPNVLALGLPFGVPAERIAQAGETWAAAFADLPRPRLGVLVGGDSTSFRLTPGAARELARTACALVGAAGGSLLVTTSPRTPPRAAEALFAAIDAPAFARAWTAERERNPFLGILAEADAFVVTGESASLLAEACGTGKPVRVFELPPRWPVRAARRWRAWRRRPAAAPPARFAAGLARSGLFTPPRDLDALHETARSRGLIEPLARAIGEGEARPAPPDDLRRAAAAVRELLGETAVDEAPQAFEVLPGQPA